MKNKATIATNRFGLGARPGEIAAAQSDPQAWILQQIKTPPSVNTSFDSNNALERLIEHRKAKKAAKKNQKSKDNSGSRLGQIFRMQTEGVISQAIGSNNSFLWRLLDFFSNHFSVSAQGAAMRLLAPTLEQEAIAPNLLGKFEDMLLAVSRHPGMLIYLNNENSFGPDSRIGRRRKNRGLNENLAREILELHTLGVNGGYQQQDVIELAMAISGWSVTRAQAKNKGFVFRAEGHQPGSRQVLGRSYAEGGVSQGERILIDLARHPSTARFVSTKLARHLVSDNPPGKLIERMSKRWLASDGNLQAVVTELVKSDDAWGFELQKFKTPREFIISACRASGNTRWPKRSLLNSLNTLGQAPFGAGSPAGYGDISSDWDGADALLTRIDWAAQFGSRMRVDAKLLAQNALGPALAPATEQAVKRAESRQQAVALLLMSPEFQRR